MIASMIIPQKVTWAHRFAKIIVVSLLVLPTVWILAYTLAFSVGLVGTNHSEFTFQHWHNALSRPSVFWAILRTLLIAGVAATATTILAISLTVLWSDAPGTRAYVALLCLMLGTPTSVYAYIVLQWLSQGGLLSRFSYHSGHTQAPNEFPILTQDPWGIGILIAMSWSTLGISWMYYSQIWRTLRVSRYLELARSLGASRHIAMKQVAIPMLIRKSQNLFLLLVLINFGAFEIPTLLGSMSTPLISVYIQRRTGNFDLQERPEAFVLAAIYFLIASVLAYLVVRGQTNK